MALDWLRGLSLWKVLAIIGLWWTAVFLAAGLGVTSTSDGTTVTALPDGGIYIVTVCGAPMNLAEVRASIALAVSIRSSFSGCTLVYTIQR